MNGHSHVPVDRPVTAIRHQSGNIGRKSASSSSSAVASCSFVRSLACWHWARSCLRTSMTFCIERVGLYGAEQGQMISLTAREFVACFSGLVVCILVLDFKEDVFRVETGYNVDHRIQGVKLKQLQ
ncbi:hypothetical protein KCV05_g251, partial [Aureobasidium melanogenum]